MRRLILPLIMLAIPALGVAWFLANYERVPVKRMTGLSGEARLRSFLAAERFAERMGMPAAELRALPQLDALEQGSVLILPAGRQAFDAALVRRLLAWVSNGGHALVEIERPGLRDALLDAVGIKRHSQDYVAPPAPLPREMFNAVVVKVDLGSDEKPLSVIFNADSKIDAGGRHCIVRASHHSAEKLCAFRHGKGTITASTSVGFARNRSIGAHNHAEFLWRLLTLTDARKLNVFFRPEQLSLWGFLREHALPVLLAAGALLAAWLWRIAPRFGPVAPDLPPARRRLLDHLRATGRYYWASGLRSRLVAAARDAALRRIARAQPDFAAAPMEERVSRLSRLIGVSSEEASSFLAAAGAARGADLIRIIQHAQRVHSVLEKGNDK